MKPEEVAAFRALAPDAQIRALRGTRAEREFQIDASRGLDTEKRTVWLSIASERPYARWWGTEILDHRAASIRAERLRAGAALLVGHDSADQVGVVEDFEITAGKRLRILARFGRSARAEEIWQDVLDGIRRNTSVGYVIHDLVLEKSEDGVNTYRVTDWEPLEGSIVSVPADPSVGVGRAHSLTKGNQQMENEDLNDQSAPGRRERDRTRVQDAATLENKRVAELYAAGREFANDGGNELAAEIIAGGGSVETFRARMLERLRGRQKPFETAEPFDAPYQFGEGAREILPKPKCFTGERAEERAYRAGMWFRGLIGQHIPRYRDERVERFLRENGLTRSMSEGVLAEGGALVPDEISPFIIDLADKYGTFRANADTYPMKSDTLGVPRAAGDPSASFVSENGALGESDEDWSLVTLTAKKLGTIVRVSTELVEDSVINVADRLVFSIGRAFAKKEDQCGFEGDATSTYGGMTGIRTLLIDGSHDASKVAAAANHDTFAEIDATDLANLLAALPEYAHEGAKFYCSQVAWSMVFWRLMAAAGGNSVATMTGNVQKSFAGYPVVTSSVLPAGASTDYSSQAMILFGNLRLSSKFGARRDIRVRILDQTYAAYDQIGVQATERFQIVNHDCGTNSVAGPMVGLVGAA